MKESPTMNPELPAWEFHLLGDFRIRQRGRLMPLPPNRCQPLLALLLLNPRELSRLEIIGQLFPDLPETQGRRYLSERLWSLRKALPDLPMEIGRESLELNRSERYLDVDRLIELLDEGDSNSRRQAASLYQGDLLPAQYDEWILLEREALRLRYVRLLHSLAQDYRRQGQIQQSLATLQQLHRIEPMDEIVVQGLMELNGILGRRSASLEVFEHYQSSLAELGLAPSEQLSAVCEEVVRSAVTDVESTAMEASGAGSGAQLQTLLERAAWPQLEARLESMHAKGKPEQPGLWFDLTLAREDTEAAAEWLERLPEGEPSSIIRRAQHAVHESHHRQAVDWLTSLLLDRGEQLTDPDAWQLHRTLASARLGLGELNEAQDSAVAANRLADRLDDPYQKASSALLSGRIRLLQGDHDGAAELLSRVVALAGKWDFKLLAARVFYVQGVMASQRGHLQEHLSNIRYCLQLVRDLGLPRFEVKVLNKLAFANDQLGRNNESLRALNQARLLLGSMDDPAGVAETSYNTASAISWHSDGDIETGLALARQAADYFQSVEANGWLASCQSLLGILQWRAGRHQQAFDHFLDAYQRHGELGESFYQKNLLGEIAIVLAELGRGDEAKQYAHKGLLFLQQDGQGDDFEVLNYYGAGRAYEVEGQLERAREYYRQAFARICELANGISDPTLKAKFMRREEVYRRVLEIVDRDALGALPLELLGSARSGKLKQLEPALGESGGEAGLAHTDGAIARRRQRLQELKADAASRGEALTVRQLAARLGVSKRTLQRDLAFLRNQR